MDIAQPDGTPHGLAGAAHPRPAATRPRYIAGFDGMRAIAVAMVIVSHAGFGRFVPGGLGVTIFFAISGFLITTLLLDEMAATGRVNLTLFYARRALRLYPELLAMIAVCLVVGALLGLRGTLAEKLAGPLYYFNYYYIYGDVQPVEYRYHWRQLWSLSVEEHFYFLFPGLLLLVGRGRAAQLWLVGALLVLPLAWRLVTYHVLHLPWEHNYVATDTRIDSIAWGCLLAILMRTAQDRPRDPRECWFVRPVVVPIAMALLVATLLARGEDFRWTWRFTIQGIAIALLIANILFDPRWQRIVTALELRPLRYVGRISYGVYLYHMVVVQIVQRIWPDISMPHLLLVASVATVAVASLSYRLLEAPLKGLRRRLGSHVR